MSYRIPSLWHGCECTSQLVPSPSASHHACLLAGEGRLGLVRTLIYPEGSTIAKGGQVSVLLGKMVLDLTSDLSRFPSRCVRVCACPAASGHPRLPSLPRSLQMEQFTPRRRREHGGIHSRHGTPPHRRAACHPSHRTATGEYGLHPGPHATLRRAAPSWRWHALGSLAHVPAARS